MFKTFQLTQDHCLVNMKPGSMFSFRWSEFELQRNIELKEIRDNHELFDVTIACDDDQIGAHKLMLSAGSKFFQQILQKTQSNHPYLYIRGCKLKDMRSVLDFLYFGEVSVDQHDVQQFMSLAKDLLIKGFELSDYVENENVSEVKSQNSEKTMNIRHSKEEQSKKSSPKPIDDYSLGTLLSFIYFMEKQ